MLYLDAIRIKIRENSQVLNRAAYIAVGVDLDEIKHVLGIWVQDTEGSAFWAHVCADLANRGVRDVLIVCCDGLKGLPEAIEATWPDSMVQTCVVHLIRAAMRFVAYSDRKKVAKALKPIYTAASEDIARKALAEFEASELGQKYPSAATTWANSWERFIPFLQFPPMLRKVIYTTNSIESLNFPAAEGDQEPRPFPLDGGGGEAALAGDLQHRRQACCKRGPRPWQAFQRAEGSGPTRRGPGRHELEAGPGTAPLPPTPTGSTPTCDHPAYTDKLTGPASTRSQVPSSAYRRCRFQTVFQGPNSSRGRSRHGTPVRYR